MARADLIDLHALLEQLELAGSPRPASTCAEDRRRPACAPRRVTRSILAAKVSSVLPRSEPRLEAFVEEQVRRYVRGEPLLYQVTYRGGALEAPGSEVV